MIIIKRKSKLAKYLAQEHKHGNTIGFVPTMGALHDGHLQLIKETRAASGCVVCSIFVNPTQFNDPADFDNYPVSLEKDILLLEAAGTDILFLPGIGELYPSGTSGLEHYQLGRLESLLEGKYRPGHFQGVCQVMHRLLDAVQPDLLFMGRKDYQQCMVVQALLTHIHSAIKLIKVETVREKDGLAMSSRNLRLSEDQRRRAIGIYQALAYIKKHIRPGRLDGLLSEARQILLDHGFRVDYLETAHAQSLEPIGEWDGKEPMVALAAAFQGDVRLIDNIDVGH